MKAMSLSKRDISLILVALVATVSIGSIASLQTFNARASAPIEPGAEITMSGYNGAVQWTQQNATLTINVPAAAQQAGKNAWAFKIA